MREYHVAKLRLHGSKQGLRIRDEFGDGRHQSEPRDRIAARLCGLSAKLQLTSNLWVKADICLQSALSSGQRSVVGRNMRKLSHDVASLASPMCAARKTARYTPISARAYHASYRRMR